MKLLSHAHINGNGTKHRNEYARILARACKKRHYTHCVVGCHGKYIASKDTMNAVRELGIIPIRFAEMALTIENNTHDDSHIAFINIPERSIKDFTGDNKKVNIKVLVPYIKEVKCKVVLCHPRSLAEIKAWASYINGYEIMNGLDRYQRHYKHRDASSYFPNLTQFIGADWHVWEGMGDLDYFTELPDDYFGRIYE